MLRIATLLAAVRRKYEAIASRSSWRAGPGSIAAADRAAITDSYKFTEQVSLLLSGLCHDFSYAAYVQIGALEALYRANEVLLSSAMLVRGVVEHCARVVWVLGSPAAEPVENRFARALLEEIAGSEQQNLTAGHLGNPQSANLRDRWRTLKAEAQAAFPSWIYDHGRPEILGFRAPSAEQAVVDMYGEFSPPLPLAQRKGIYDYLSNYVHPTPYVIRELFQSELRDDGGIAATLSRDPEADEKLARIAVVPFHFALAQIISYHGWPGDWLRELEDDIESVMPGTFIDSRPISDRSDEASSPH